jgi:hypothetical protein
VLFVASVVAKNQLSRLLRALLCVHSFRLPRVASACLNSGFMGIPFFWRGALADRVEAQLCWLSTALALLGLVRGNSRVSSNCSELDNALRRGDGARITYTPGFLNALRRSSVSLRKLVRQDGADAPHQDAGEELRALFGMHCLPEGNGAIAGSGQPLLCKISVTNTITCMKPDCHCSRSYIVCEPLLEVQIKANTLEGCLQWLSPRSRAARARQARAPALLTDETPLHSCLF